VGVWYRSVRRHAHNEIVTRSLASPCPRNRPGHSRSDTKGPYGLTLIRCWLKRLAEATNGKTRAFFSTDNLPVIISGTTVNYKTFGLLGNHRTNTWIMAECWQNGTVYRAVQKLT